MNSGIRFYGKPNTLESNSFEDDLFGSEEDDDFDDHGYSYEVPYTSSSIDRSSVGSIPWADDAIKINKMAWEKVERMLCGLEPLSTTEDDLSKEVLDWQKKFPQLLNIKTHKKSLASDTFDLESMPSLEFTTEDEDYESEGKLTLSRQHNTNSQSVKNSLEEDSNNLCKLLDNFTLTSMPLKLSQREINRTPIKRRKCASSTSSYSIRSPPTPLQHVPSVTTSSNRFRMPPILNVLDSKRKFRNLSQNKNPSFVQLTQIQAKSAAVVHEQKSRPRFHTSYKSAWHVPFAANRFSNNRNSIILPSISTTQQVIERYSTQPTTTSTTNEIGTLNTTPSSGTRENLPIKNNNMNSLSCSNASTQTNMSNTARSGRSISAAVKYPRVTPFNALYLPYSASKFHVFK